MPRTLTTCAGAILLLAFLAAGPAPYAAGDETQAANDDSGFVQLFDGKTLDGWTRRGGDAEYSVEDGMIVGQTVPNTSNTFLCTDKHYADFILEYDFKCDPELNSGVQIRSNQYDEPEKYTVDGEVKTVPAERVHGYQIEIDVDPNKDRWWTAGLYEEGRRGWLYPGMLGGDKEAFTNQGREVTKQNAWNHIRVVAVGNHIKTYLNGELRTDCTDNWDGRDASGFVGLQVHSVGGREEPLFVRFRDIRLKEL